MLKRGMIPDRKSPYRMEAGAFPVIEPGAANGCWPSYYVRAVRSYGSPENLLVRGARVRVYRFCSFVPVRDWSGILRSRYSVKPGLLATAKWCCLVLCF
jgi:hypothetical protein